MANHFTNETANAVLERLRAADFWTKGTSLQLALNVPDEHYAKKTFGQTLQTLEKVGHLRRSPYSKFKWRLTVETMQNGWDRDRPFTPRPGFTPSTPPPEPTPAPNEFPKTREPDDSTSRELADSVEVLRATVRTLSEELEDVKAMALRTTKTLTVERWDGTVTELKDVVLPAYFKRVLDLAKCRRNVLLVGPAGCGKSHLAGLVAETLGLRFGSLSCTSGMSEAHLLGRGIPDLTHGKTKFQGTDFLTCYEEGGVFLLDELDAADPNLLLAINTALANGYCNVPNRPEKPRAKKHKDFVLIATANTFGRGANRQYSGRNQLDEATLDRFRIGTVECQYDPAVEAAVCPDDLLRGALQSLRERIVTAGLRRIMSTRFMQDAYTMAAGAGWTKEQILETYFEGWSADERAKVGLY